MRPGSPTNLAIKHQLVKFGLTNRIWVQPHNGAWERLSARSRLEQHPARKIIIPSPTALAGAVTYPSVLNTGQVEAGRTTATEALG